MNISIAMTTYNGEKYLLKQLKSIIIQMKMNDELIISDDGSTDNTIAIIKSVMRNNPRIKLFHGSNKGCEKNFEYTIKKCNNEIILLSDQDDIWMSEKLETIRKYFISNPDIKVVVHDAIIIDGEDNIKNRSIFSMGKLRRGVIPNIYKSVFFGCCMGFRNEMINIILPFPEKIPLHDIWIAIIGEGLKCLGIIEKPLICYRRHESNLSQKSTLYFQTKYRFKIFIAYIGRWLKSGKIKT